MGYRAKRKKIHLKFEGDYEGLEVTAHGLTLGQYLEITGLGEVDVSAVTDQMKRFAESLISWNLEDEDCQPIPAIPEAVYAQDQDFMFHILGAWMDGMAGVSAPLEQTSPAGEQSLVESIPMDALSKSLVS